MKKYTRGFTLIELLVVISIIGMLSSVILVGLQTTRVKARNSIIVQEVQQLRNQIELGKNGDVYPQLIGTNPSPNGSSDTRVAHHSFGSLYPGVVLLITDILKQNSFTYPSGYAAAYSNGGGGCSGRYSLDTSTNGIAIFIDNTSCSAATKYAIYAAMGPIVGSSGYFCIDSTGKITNPLTGSIPQNPTVAATCQ